MQREHHLRQVLDQVAIALLGRLELARALEDLAFEDVDPVLDVQRPEVFPQLGEIRRAVVGIHQRPGAMIIAAALAGVLDADHVGLEKVGGEAGRVTGQGPAHRLVRAPEQPQMLLGLVRMPPQAAHAVMAVFIVDVDDLRLDVGVAGEGMHARPAADELLDRVRVHVGVEQPGVLVAAAEAVAGQNNLRGVGAERLDELLAQRAHRVRVQQDRAPTAEFDRALVRPDFDEGEEVQLIRAHPPSPATSAPALSS